MPFGTQFFARLQTRIADAQFEAILAQTEADLRPKVSLTVMVAVLISLAILATPLAVAGFGIWLIITTNASVGGLIFGGLLLLVGYFLFPAASDEPADSFDRRDLPETFKLVDAVSDRTAAPRVDRIAILTRFNAFMGSFGRRRVRTLGIDLALWQSLNESERLALISHEIAHELNGDPARSILIGSAEETLARWRDILATRPDDGEDAGAGFIVVLAQLIMGVVAFFVRLLLSILFLLHMRISQRAEYYADLLAARNASTAAMQSLLRKLVCRPLLISLIVRSWSNKPTAAKEMLLSFRERIAAGYGDEIERLLKEMQTERSSVDASHPPTIYRLRFLDAHSELSGEFDASTVDWLAIEAELDRFLEPAGQALMAQPDLI